MMKEQVILTKISIKRQGERKHFQIKLPKNTKFIIGIEYGARWIDKTDVVKVAAAVKVKVSEERRVYFKRNQLIGELKLQSCEEANWFYSTDVFVADANIKYGDFSQSGFPVNDFTHGNKRTEEIVKVDAESTIVQGWYLDAIGKTSKSDINYEVKVYVWINVEE